MGGELYIGRYKKKDEYKNTGRIFRLRLNQAFATLKGKREDPCAQNRGRPKTRRESPLENAPSTDSRPSRAKVMVALFTARAL